MASSRACRGGRGRTPYVVLQTRTGSDMSTNTTRNLVERLDRLLPQTQCGQCGYDGCRPYAEAMVAGDADIDRCPPGGDAGARALARMLDVAPTPYARRRGPHNTPQVALVGEADCTSRPTSKHG